MHKIALLLYDYSLYGGAEKVALKLANEFVGIYEVHLISCFCEKSKIISAMDEKIHCFVISQEVQSMTINAAKISKKLRKYLLTNEIDVVINITAGVNTVSFLATLNTSVKTIYAEHSNLLNQTYGKKHQFRQWLGAKTSDYIVTLTEQDKNEFIKRYNVGKKCTYIYNWFDGHVISEQYDEHVKKIITVGRLASVKGYDRLIEIAKQIFEEYPDWTWDIYGDGELKKKIEDLIQENGLNNNLFLKGNRKDVIDLYKKYSFFVMTSYYEGLPLALLEAKASLLPIISFDCPTGPSEIIVDGYDGFLVENGNINKMVRKIKTLVMDDKLRREFSKHSMENMKKFSKELIYGQWCELINKLCEKKG